MPRGGCPAGGLQRPRQHTSAWPLPAHAPASGEPSGTLVRGTPGPVGQQPDGDTPLTWPRPGARGDRAHTSSGHRHSWSSSGALPQERLLQTTGHLQFRQRCWPSDSYLCSQKPIHTQAAQRACENSSPVCPQTCLRESHRPHVLTHPAAIRLQPQLPQWHRLDNFLRT